MWKVLVKEYADSLKLILLYTKVWLYTYICTYCS